MSIVTCPTCGMSASRSDLRQLQPVPSSIVGSADLRSCRNCGDVIDLAAARLDIAVA